MLTAQCLEREPTSTLKMVLLTCKDCRGTPAAHWLGPMVDSLLLQSGAEAAAYFAAVQYVCTTADSAAAALRVEGSGCCPVGCGVLQLGIAAVS